jgi:hypothetical protein
VRWRPIASGDTLPRRIAGAVHGLSPIRWRGDRAVSTEREGGQPGVLHLLAPDEALHVEVRAREGTLALTDRRLVVTDGDRIALDIAYEGLRRIQLDVERGRDATLVVVPDSPRHLPQVLTIGPADYRRAADAVMVIGEKLARS